MCRKNGHFVFDPTYKLDIKQYLNEIRIYMLFVESSTCNKQLCD